MILSLSNRTNLLTHFFGLKTWSGTVHDKSSFLFNLITKQCDIKLTPLQVSLLSFTGFLEIILLKVPENAIITPVSKLSYVFLWMFCVACSARCSVKLKALKLQGLADRNPCNCNAKAWNPHAAKSQPNMQASSALLVSTLFHMLLQTVHHCRTEGIPSYAARAAHTRVINEYDSRLCLLL